MLANSLRDHGVDVELDRYHVRPPQGWPRWCEEQLRPENSRYVLAICTQAYRSRIEGKTPANEGRGVYWEGDVIYNYIYDAKANGRFIPVILSGAKDEDIPLPLQGATRYRLDRFELADEGFEALYRELTEQHAIIKPKLGSIVVLKSKTVETTPKPRPLPVREAVTGFDPPAAYDISRIDSYAPENLIGREAETKIIDDAWTAAVRGEPKRPRVLTFVAMGGEGKTSLVADWAVRRQVDGWPECEAAFAWTFFSQGARDSYAGDSDLFLAEALKFFGGETKEGEGAVEKAKRLARLIGAKCALLILDGLEPLQYPSGPPHDGRLKDDAILALLKWLATNGKALVLVTTRVAIVELQAGALEPAAPQHDLTRLSTSAGVALLTALGVKGSKDEYEALVEETHGHALTLTFLGSYLKRAHQGDIRRFDRVEWDKASKQYKNDYASRAMATYEKFLIQGDAAGAREIAILRLMGLFDRPADAGCLKTLLGEPIANLNEALVAADEHDFNLALSNLESEKLLTVNRDRSGALVSLDAHPLLREYFANELREKNPERWKAAHQRLYEHLCATETDKKDAPTLDDLRPLFQAVAHGCHAGLQMEACEKVYHDRISRGTGFDGFYSTKKLGAFGADLGAVACFFDAPWSHLSPNLLPSGQAWLLAKAAFDLRALGRLREALEPMRAGLVMRVEQKDWRNAAAGVGNISESALTLGDVAAALRAGAESVDYADRSADDILRMAERAVHADALHQHGALEEARTLFDEAEAMQKNLQPDYPLLYSLQGSCYCDFLLGPAERAVWRLLLPPAIVEGMSAPGGARFNDADMDRAPPGAQNATRQSRAARGSLDCLAPLAMTMLKHSRHCSTLVRMSRSALSDRSKSPSATTGVATSLSIISPSRAPGFLRRFCVAKRLTARMSTRRRTGCGTREKRTTSPSAISPARSIAPSRAAIPARRKTSTRPMTSPRAGR